MKFSLASVFLLITFGCISANAQSIYKWVDEDGVTHFSEQRPPDIEAERTSIKVESGYRPPSPEATATAAERRNAAKTRRQEQRQQTAEEKAQAAADRQVRAENCAKARDRSRRYETAQRMYNEGEDGERIYLDDAELDATRAEARQQVAEWCD